MKLCIVFNKRSDNSFRPDKAFIHKTNALAYIDEEKAKDPEAQFDTEVVDLDDIEQMKVYQLIAPRCHSGYPDWIFYNKTLANSAIKIFEYPEGTRIREHTLKGPKFLDKYMEEKGIVFYMRYQVTFTTEGDIDTTDPLSNTITEFFGDPEGIVENEAVVDNDDPYKLHLSVYFKIANPISKEELLAMCQAEREAYFHNKFNLET